MNDNNLCYPQANGEPWGRGEDPDDKSSHTPSEQDADGDLVTEIMKTSPDVDPLSKGGDNGFPNEAITRIAVDIKQMTGMFPFSVRTLRRMDSDGRLPAGFKLGGRKLWRVVDLERWAELGFPARTDFERQVRAPNIN
ncbi:MAG: hypothetical protein HJJLKODD_01914 [Phycisphaerae bacterium]|nr:hypothetical protein [Phycisphaerae bacterium]